MTTSISVNLDDTLSGKIRQLAEQRQQSSRWIVREAISQYVAREESRERLNTDTLDAWQEFQQTGLHATAEEVDQWLSSWGSATELPPPRCHK